MSDTNPGGYEIFKAPPQPLRYARSRKRQPPGERPQQEQTADPRVPAKQP